MIYIHTFQGKIDYWGGKTELRHKTKIGKNEFSVWNKFKLEIYKI